MPINIDGEDKEFYKICQPDERGAGDFLPLVSFRDLQQHQERQGRRPEASGKWILGPLMQSYNRFLGVH